MSLDDLLRNLNIFKNIAFLIGFLGKMMGLKYVIFLKYTKNYTQKGIIKGFRVTENLILGLLQYTFLRERIFVTNSIPL